MNKQIKGLLYFFVANTRHSFIIFWSILLGITFVTLTGSYMLKDQDGGIMTLTLTAPMYVYCGIYGFIIVKQWIPFFIKLGATRKNILMSLGLFFGGVSLLFASIGSALQSIITIFAEKIGLSIFSFLHLSYFFEDTWYTRILIDSSIMLFCFTLMFMIGLLFYKHGLAIGGSVLGLLFVAAIFSAFKGWLVDFAIYVFKDVNLLLFWQIALVALVLYGFSWFFVRNITIVNAR